MSKSIVSCVIPKHLTKQTAREIIQGLFFSEKRYDLGEVGRYRINTKLSLTYLLETKCIDQTKTLSTSLSI
ncbi:MAG: hypothetical protein U5N85_16490 [Arcicella sp.]|nr:hypothetical protein [Arcicella sp.]